MLRYVIGISLLTLGIIIVRALSDGKVLRKHQYAFWIVIPLFMILFPLIKIDLPNETDLRSWFSRDAETIAYDVQSDAAPTATVPESVPIETENAKKTIDLEPHYDPEAVQKEEQIAKYVASENKIKATQKAEASFKFISSSISAVLILALIAYNAGFLLYCRRNRKYVGKDPLSRLGIYSLRHKETPFLLFNKIYVAGDQEKNNEYIICHEACHYRHGDYLWVFIRYLVLLLNWYNPVIWAAFILSGRDCELACDEEVVHIYGKDYSKDYARTLFGMLQQRSVSTNLITLTTGMRHGYKTMRKRLISIKKPARTSRKALALSLSAILLFTSCSFIKTPRQPKKITEDTPWFESTVINVESGADPDKEIEYSYQYFAGSDESYIVVLTTGRYKQPPEDQIDWNTYNYNDYNFATVAVVDRKTSSVVNTIDLTVDTDKDLLTNEQIDTAVYADGKITVKTNSKERDYDPLTGELADTRESASDYHSNSSFYNVGEYIIDAESIWDNSNYCVLNIKDPEGNDYSIEIKETGTSIYVSAVLAINETTALIPASTGKGDRFYILDLTNNELTTAKYKDYEWIDVDNLNYSFAGSDGEVYYRAYDGIYRVNVAQKTNEKVFDYSWCDINRGLVEQLDITECFGDSFILIGQTEPTSIYAENPHTFQIVELKKADTNPHAGKTVLLLSTWLMDENMGKAIEIFNTTNEEYYIEVTYSYVKNGNLAEDGYFDLDEDGRQSYDLNSESGGSNEIAMDIINGEGPDILIGMSGLGSLNNPDYLVDLYPYVKDFDSNDYFTNIIEGSKTGDAIYQLPVTFSVEGIFTDAEYAGSSGVGFTLDEYHTFVKTTLNGTDLISLGQAFYFTKLFSSMSDTFISDGKADLTGTEFESLAEYVKDYVPEKSTSIENFPWGEVCQVVDYMPCYGVGTFFKMYSGTGMVKNPTILGTPSLDGRGPMYTTNYSVAVSAKATNIDACVEFVKILLSDEIQKDYALDDYFVLNRNAFKEGGNAAIEYYNAGGSRTAFGDGVGLKNGELYTTEDIDNIENVILSCSTIDSRDADICKILVEEMPAYFLGQKDLDSVIYIAQDRIQKVLDERG